MYTDQLRAPFFMIVIVLHLRVSAVLTCHHQGVKTVEFNHDMLVKIVQLNVDMLVKQLN